MADGSQHSLSYILESTYGTTPATPTMTPVEMSSCNINMTKGQIQSNTIRSDRQIIDQRHGARLVGGGFGCDAKYGGFFDDMLEACLCGTWSTNVLKAGVTRRSFTFERLFSDIASGNKYFRYTGCEISGMTLTVDPNSMITCQFNVIGQNQTNDSAIITGETYSAATATLAYDAFDGSISEGGSSNGCITSITINIDNGMAARPVIGTDLTKQPSIGNININGSFTAFFETAAEYEKFLNETATSITVDLIDPAGNELEIDMSSIVYTAADAPVTSDGAIIVTMNYQAIYNASDASNIVITRTAA